MRFIGAITFFLILPCCVLETTRDAPDGRTQIKLWRHETADEELNESLATIDRFNRGQSRWHIAVETLPQGAYTESVTAAALAQQLPCILDVDQPVVPNFAWTGHLRPLDGLVDEALLASINAGAKGRFRDKTYSIGQFDVALALFTRRSVLAKRGIRVATLENPYTPDEFLKVLAKLKAADTSRYPLDINTIMTGEWLAYGFSPWFQSAGADLIDRKNFVEAEGVLNGSAAVGVARWYQRLFEQAYVPRRAVDDLAFLQGQADIHYTGSWVAIRYERKFGDDLVIMPPVDF
ncbi:MAG: sugar ABC transporter substrate-binding protein, partial [Myxococcota bacterium]